MPKMPKLPKMPKIEVFCPSRASRREPQGQMTGSNDQFYKKKKARYAIIFTY